MCDERRRDNLRLVELHSRSVTLCHICAARTLKLAKIPGTLDELAPCAPARSSRRTIGAETAASVAIFPRERRVGDRRGPPRASCLTDTNPGFVMPDFEDIEIEIQDADIEIVEQTLVRERPKLPSP